MTSVLMTADAVGGVWNYSLTLAGALAGHGTEVTLAVMGPAPTADQLAELEATPVRRLHHRPFALEWMEDPWPDVELAGAWLLELESLVRPDVVHLNGYVHGDLPFRAPTVMVAHSDVLSWWEAVHRRPAPPEWGEYARRVAIGLSAAGALVAPTEAALKSVRRTYGAPHGFVVHNGLCRDRIVPAAKEPVMLGAGRLWDEAKNLGLLQDVAPRLSWPVVVAGDRGSAEHAATPNLTLLGRLPSRQLESWMARAAIFVHPARYEPFGLAVLEAALSGCALVLGDIDSLRELWDGAALFAGPSDPDEWLDRLERLVAHPRERSGLAERAQSRARQFAPSRTAAKYVAVYRSLCPPTPGAS